MNKILLSLLLSFIVLSSSANAMGLIFTQATKPVTATCVKGCDPCCIRCGCSNYINILGLFEFGDGGIDAAAKNGCIKLIQHVDQTESSFLIFFRKIKTTVYGY